METRPLKVLVITGDRLFKKGHIRFDIQASAVKKMSVLYWGPDALWPRIPKGSYDVISTQDPFFRGFLGWLLSGYFNAKLNVQVHADIAVQNAFRKRLARFVLSRADSIRVVSDKLKEQVGHYQRRTAIVTVLPVYVNIDRFKNSKRNASGNPRILWVGRFEEEKDPFLAVTVFKQVRVKIPSASLVMIGTGTLERQLKIKTKNLPVEFPGWRDPLPFLEEAHVVLSTSQSESWGASIVEALAAGVSVVAPDVGIAKEAGATVVERKHLADAVTSVLNSKVPGELKIPILSKEAWISTWLHSLV